MEFRILGPLEVRDGGRELSLGAPRQRALGAILLLHANQVVSTDRLIDELWGEDAPPTASHVIQVYVSQLRKVLNRSARILVTRAPGYLLLVEPGQLDLDRFERLSTAGRAAIAAGDPHTASARLAEALALWRGPPLDDFAYEPFAQREIARLGELRIAALEDRVDSDLELGRHRGVVGELEGLVSDYPLRERLRASLMLALYRSGRQADALAAYRDARHALVEDLGIEPSPALAELERRILRQEPGLELPSPGPPDPRGGRRAKGSRRRSVLAVTAASMVAALAAALALALSEDTAGPPTSLPPNSVGRIDAESNRILGATLVGSGPTHLVAGEGAIWVANFDDETLSKLDPSTGEELRRISAEGTPTGLASGAGAVWMTHDFAGTLSRIDPGLETIVATIELGSGVTDVAVGEHGVWIVNSLRGRLLRVDPATNDVVATIDLGGTLGGVAVGGGAVWVASGRTVVRVDPATLTLRRVALRYNAGELAVGEGAVWVANGLGDAVTRVDLASATASSAVAVGDNPSGIAVGGGVVWVANSVDGTLSRIDPTTGVVTGTIVVADGVEDVAVSEGTVWVSAPQP